MTTNPDPFFNAAFVINSIIGLLSFYAAWANLINKRISKFGFDTFLLFIFQFIDKKHAVIVRKDPILIRRMGFMMILFGIGSLIAVFS